MPQINVEVAPKLSHIFGMPARFRIAYGGRGSGKSWGFARMFLVEMLRNPNTPFLAARELQNSIKDSVHKLLSDQAHACGLAHLFDIGDSYFRCNNGAYVIFRGLRTNANEIKSLEGVKIAWVEEAQKVSKDSLELLIPTIRAAGSELWFTYNPSEEEDAIHQLAQTPRPDMKVIKINWNDNPWFSKEMDDERAFMQLNDPEAYDHVWEGNCKKFAGGSIYGKLMVEAKEQGRVTSVPYNPAFPVFTAWDLGYSDTLSIGFGQIVGKEPRLIDYYENNLEAIGHYVDVIRKKPYRYDAHVLPHDAGHKSLRTGTTLAAQIRELGLHDVIVLPVDSIEPGIELVRNLLPQLWFDEVKTERLVKALMAYQYEYDEERQMFRDRPLHDWSSHCADMVRYMATYLARKRNEPIAKLEMPHYVSQTGSWMG